MSEQPKSKVSRFLEWRYCGCGLPFLGILLVLLYLAIFSIYRFWGVGLSGSKPTDVSKFYFGTLTGLLHNLGDPSSAEIYNAITAKNVVVWGYGTGLVVLSLLSAIVISGFVIFKAPRGWTSRQKGVLTFRVLLFCLVVYPLISRQLSFFDNFTVIPRQFWGLIRYQLRAPFSLLDIVNIEMFIVAIAYAVSTLLAFASAATLWPVRELEVPDSATSTREIDEAAKYLSRQMKHLRLILYAGAILLVVITFRHRMTFNWALDYLQPLPLLKNYPSYEYAGLIYEQLKSLTSNIVLATSVLNTLLLAALYVPSALLLQHRAHLLSKLAFEVESRLKMMAEDSPADEYSVGTKRNEPKSELELRGPTAEQQSTSFASWQDGWLKSRNLIFPFKDQVPKVIAILSPLLAGPLGELLNFLK